MSDWKERIRQEQEQEMSSQGTPHVDRAALVRAEWQRLTELFLKFGLTEVLRKVEAIWRDGLRSPDQFLKADPRIWTWNKWDNPDTNHAGLMLYAKQRMGKGGDSSFAPDIAGKMRYTGERSATAANYEDEIISRFEISISSSPSIPDKPDYVNLLDQDVIPPKWAGMTSYFKFDRHLNRQGIEVTKTSSPSEILERAEEAAYQSYRERVRLNRLPGYHNVRRLP